MNGDGEDEENDGCGGKEMKEMKIVSLTAGTRRATFRCQVLQCCGAAVSGSGGRCLPPPPPTVALLATTEIPVRRAETARGRIK